MHITTIALITAIIGLVSSFFLVGIIPSLVSFIMGIRLFLEEKSIDVVRILAISFAGILLPVVMYLNTFGLHLPDKDGSGRNFYQRIMINNYSNLGIGLGFIKEESPLEDVEPAEIVAVESPESDEMTYYTNKPKTHNGPGKETETDVASESDLPEIFESLDSIAPSEKNKGGIISIAPSDDDMPSYGGLPVGTLIIAQYFREDDHNANPVLVLQNKTGEMCRYECIFTARDKDGNEMATSDRTVEVVRDGSVFVFEGRFDKKDLGGGIPDAFEFSISKRSPYEKDMSTEITVYTATEDNSVILTAENLSDRRVKVDAYVLFFDGKELVDCMWMIPQNTGEVCVDPGSSASIKGDAYYRFDRVETYYTAYEAVGE